MPLIDGFESRLLVGIPAMDRSHREFVDLVNRMDRATDPSLAYLLPELLHHTRAHFATEEVLMRLSGYPQAEPHRVEHARVLAEMEHFSQRLGPGGLAVARAYVRKQLPAWFERHALQMDGPLAEHLRSDRPVPGLRAPAIASAQGAQSPAGEGLLTQELDIC
ncbi:MAG: bacteriohemerythrin [Bdellovibrio bacteriovorus]